MAYNIQIRNFIFLAVLSCLIVSTESSHDLGCFREQITPIYFSFISINPAVLTRQRCIESCSALSKDYAILRAGMSCFCSNTNPANELVPEAGKCTVPCLGDTLETCGGYSHVYAFGVKPVLRGTLSASPSVALAGETVDIVTDTSPPNTAYVQRMSYDGGVDFSDFAVNGTGLSQWTWHAAGSFEIESELTDDELLYPPTSTTQMVDVISPVDNVTLYCPNFAATFEPLEIPMTVSRGTGFALDVTLTPVSGPSVSQLFSASDAKEDSLGNTIVPSTDTSAVCINGLVVHTARPAEFDGYLVGIEYYGTGSGTVNVHLYRPACPTSGMEYCPLTHDCKTHAACGITCGGAGGFCSSQDDCCNSATVTSTTLLAGATYSRKYTWPVSISTGHGFMNLTDVPIVKGDVLAHDATSPLFVANRSSGASPWSDYYCDNLINPATFTDTSGCVPVSEFHMLSGVYVQESTVQYDVTFTTTGVNDIQVTASNDLHADTDSCSVTVLEGIDACMLVVPTDIARDEPTIFAVLPHTGGATNIFWDFGNGDTRNEPSPGQYSYTYANDGDYVVTVNISNAVSFKMNTTTVHVSQRITGFGLIVGAAVETSVEEDVNITMLTGSNYTCFYDFIYPDITQTDHITTVESDGHSLPYIFDEYGSYQISVTCSNNINLVTASTTVKSIERITGIALTPSGAKKDVEFRLVLSWITGSDVIIDYFRYNGNDVRMNIEEHNRLAKSGKMVETSTVLIPVTYQVRNLLSTETVSTHFVIEIRITNAILGCTFPNRLIYPYNSPVVLPVGNRAECDVSMTNGTSVNIVGKWDDGPDYNQSAAVSEPWGTFGPTLVLPITHTYNTPGTYSLQFLARNEYNEVSESYEVKVMGSVAGITLRTISDTNWFDPPAAFTFYFDGLPTPLPNDVTFIVEWGDGTGETFHNIDLTANVFHNYQDKDGDLIVKYSIFNLLDSQNGTLPVYIVAPIVGMECYVNPAAGLPNVNLEAIFKAARAPPNDVLDITYDCDTSVTGDEFTRKRINNSPDGLDVHNCLYGSTGSYTMQITATSRMETQTCDHTFKVLNGVKDNFALTTNAPRNFDAENDCDMTFAINYPDLPLPDDATIQLEYDDGIITTQPFVNAVTNIMHTFAAPGHYTCTLTISNDASIVWRTFNCGCYQSFGAVSFDVLREPLIPVGAPDAVGYPPTFNLFRLDEYLKIHATLVSGTFVRWEVVADSTGHTIICNKTDENIASLLIDQPGSYTIDLTPVNPVHTGTTVRKTITVTRPTSGIVISDFGTVGVNALKVFKVEMEEYGSDMCVVFDSGDWTNTEVETYGDPATCATYDPALIDNKAAVAGPLVLDLTMPFNFTHSYTMNGTYNMRVFAWNMVSSANQTFEFPISALDCTKPNLIMLDRHPGFRNPRRCKRRRRCKFIGLVDIACKETLHNTKNWRVFEVDPTTGEDDVEIDISSLSSRTKSELAITKRFLQYGLYRVEYTVTMITDGDGSFSSKIDTYLQVVESKLVVMADKHGTQKITVGNSDTVLIDAATYSYDPDDEVANFDGFTIACRSLTAGEQFTTTEVDVYVNGVPPAHVNIGGCFQTGPGVLKGVNGILSFSTTVLQTNSEYEFLITGYKNSRSSKTYYQISVIGNNPPRSSITYKVPDLFLHESSQTRFDPSSQLGFVGTVILPKAACQYYYQWRFFAKDYQYCDCCNCWRPLDYLYQYIEGNNGVYSEAFTIHTGLFSHYTDVKYFKLDLTTTCYDGVSNSSGVTTLNLTRNTPPANGSCTISPTNGIAGVTLFDLSCSGFVDDEDEVDGYIIKCKTRGTKWVKVASSETTTFEPRNLPPGDPNNNDILKCKVIVSDDRKSSGEYILGDIQVTSLSVDAYIDQLLAENSTDQNVYEVNDAIANRDKTAAKCLALSSIMDAFNEDAEDHAYASIQTASAMKRSQLSSTKARTNAFKTLTENATQTEMYEKGREIIAHISGRLTETLGRKCKKADSPEEAIEDAETVLLVTNSVVTVSEKSQKTINKILGNALEALRENSDSSTVEEATEIAKNVFGTCSNSKQAGNINTDLPTNVDIKAQEPNIPYFSTNKYSKIEDIAMTTDEAEMMDFGKRKLHKRDQKDTLEETINKCNSMANELTYIVASKTVSAQTISFQTENSETQILNKKSSDIESKSVEVGGCKITMPPVSDDPEEQAVISVSASASPPGPWADSGKGLVNGFSRAIEVNVMKGKKAKKIANFNPTPINIAQDPNMPLPEDLPLIEPFIAKGDVFFSQSIDVPIAGTAIRMHYRPNATDFYTQFLVLVSYKKAPRFKKGKWKNVVQTCMIPSDTRFAGIFNGTEDAYSCYVDSSIVGKNTGKYWFSLRQLGSTELNNYETMDNLPDDKIPVGWYEDLFSVTYTNWAVLVTCGASQNGDPEVSSEGIWPVRSSGPESVNCMTTHFTTFGGGWAVAPNTIDWDFIFSNADFLKNPTLYVTEIVILLVYIIAMIWARRKDRQDVEKLGLAPLPCNDRQDKYYYEIMVSTGIRRGAGTESKVHFILSGEEEETEVRTFEDKKRKIFCRGNTDGFLMSVPSPLGALMYLRIWHDNSGKGRNASWYLNHVLVRDVQTEKKYYFIANRWFAVEEDDGMVDRIIPIAGKEQMTEFSHMFAEKATKNLSDGHLWFSVVARPPQSRFTRCQRVSCCLCLLYTSMLANAMFYGTETADSNAFTFGPFALTSKQVFIGIVCNIIVFPVNFLLIHLFRKSRPRKLRPSRLEEALKSNTERTTSMADVNPRVKSSLDFERPGSSFLMDAKRSTSVMSRPESSMSSVQKTDKKKKKCELPWWFTVVAWILLWLVVLVSAAFVTFYGISFQDMKCKKWITSMLISFFTSVFLTQPIKVFLFAIVFSLIIKNPGGDEDEDDDEEAPKKIECDEEYLHEEDDEFGMISPRRPQYKPKPLDTKALESARKQRLKEIQMWAVIREILFYAFFLWVLLVISYRSVNNNSYNYKHNMEKVFIKTNDTNKSFVKIKNTPDFWSWAKSGMLRGLRAGPYYNNFPPFYMRGYINDKVSRLMGPAVLRQVRIQPDTCTLPSYVESVIDECNGLHGISLEQEDNFGAGWTQLTANNSREEYTYKSASELDGYPYWGESAMYGGGGYIVNLNEDYFDMIDHLEQLEQEGWVDKYTRAVFLEFTVYNPSINLFSISTLAAEFRPSGGVFPAYRFEPCNLLPYMNSGLLLQIACEIMYLGFTIFFLVTMVKNLVKQKSEFFSQFWNLVDLGISAMSVTAIVIYFYRLVCINELTEYFQATSGDGYVKFQYVGYWSEIFNYIIGFLVFFATLKFLKLLRFNRKISLLSDTLRNSSKDLIHFSIIFNVTFLAFMQVFYLVYMSHLDTFKTFLGSCEAGIVMMMGKFDIYNMLAVNQWLTQIFIFMFVVTITFIVVNMMLSILNDTFTAVRNDKNKQTNDYEIVDFMLNRFKMWTGIGRASTTISPAELERQRKAKSIEEQVDQLPDQIDRFLASISNMYIGDAKFDNFLQKGMAQKMAMKAKAHDPPPFHPAPVPRLPGSQRLSHGVRGMTDVQTD